MNIEERAKKYPQYFKSVKRLKYIDVYRVLALFEVTDNEIGHAIKKLMAPGKRGSKDKIMDIKEAIDSLERHLEMIKEDQESESIPIAESIRNVISPPCPPPFAKSGLPEIIKKDQEAEDLRLSRMSAISQIGFVWVSNSGPVSPDGSCFSYAGMNKGELEEIINSSMKVELNFRSNTIATPGIIATFIPNDEYNNKS